MVYVKKVKLTANEVNSTALQLLNEPHRLKLLSETQRALVDMLLRKALRKRPLNEYNLFVQKHRPLGPPGEAPRDAISRVSKMWNERKDSRCQPSAGEEDPG